MEYTKENDTTLLVETVKYTEDGEPYTVSNTYTKDFLEKQVESITVFRDGLIADKERELTQVQELLDKCTELGIFSAEDSV